MTDYARPEEPHLDSSEFRYPNQDFGTSARLDLL